MCIKVKFYSFAFKSCFLPDNWCNTGTTTEHWVGVLGEGRKAKGGWRQIDFNDDDGFTSGSRHNSNPR